MVYEIHEAADIFQMMEDIQSLADDIKEHGLAVPIELLDGKIIDGRNRYAACQIADVEPRFVDVTTNDPVAYVLSRNLHRRHLTQSQKALVADRVRDYYDKQAKARQIRKPAESVPETFPGQNGDARDQAGKAVGVSGRTVDKAKKVREEGHKDLVKAVEAGKIDVTNAAKIAELPKDVQDTILADAVLNKWSPHQMAEEAKRLSGEPVRQRTSHTKNGLQYAKMAIVQLEKISPTDGQRAEAFELVMEWIKENQ